MGFWDVVKKIGGTIGDIGKVASPFLTFIPGVGPLAAAGIGGLSGLLGRLNDPGGLTLGSGLTGGLGGAAIGGLGALGLDKLGGLGGSIGAIPGIGGMGATGGSPTSITDTFDYAGEGALRGGSGTGGGLLGRVWDWVKANPMDAAGLGLAGLTAIQSKRDTDRQRAQEEKAQSWAEEMDRARKPFRDALAQQPIKPPPPPPDYSAVFADPGNPFSRSSTLARALGF